MEFTELPQKYEDIYIQAIRCEKQSSSKESNENCVVEFRAQ